jgi:hypothetical protein
MARRAMRRPPSSAARRSLLVLTLTLACAAVFTLLLASAALAHIPRLTERGATLETAIVVEEPAVSWVYYGVIEQPGDAWYYRMDFEAGDRIYLQVISPSQTDPPPSLALMGPGLTPEGQLPPGVEAPPGVPVIVREGTPGEAEYEPFTPGAYYFPAVIDMPAPAGGTYYAAVFNMEEAGPFGLAIGYLEEYTLPAWVRLPVDLTRIYAWQHGWAVTVVPALVVLAVGASLLACRARGRRWSPSAWLAAAAGLFFFASAATVLTQMVLAAGKSGASAAMGVTMAFIVLPAIVGAVLIWLGLSMPAVVPWQRRVVSAVLAVAGLVLLGGFLIGPLLALAAAAAPPWRGSRTS